MSQDELNSVIKEVILINKKYISDHILINKEESVNIGENVLI